MVSYIEILGGESVMALGKVVLVGCWREKYGYVFGAFGRKWKKCCSQDLQAALLWVKNYLEGSTGGKVDHGKLIHLSVSRHTYSGLNTLFGL